MSAKELSVIAEAGCCGYVENSDCILYGTLQCSAIVSL